MDISNSNGGPITIDRLFAYWVKSPPSQKLDQLLLDGNRDMEPIGYLTRRVIFQQKVTLTVQTVQSSMLLWEAL